MYKQPLKKCWRSRLTLTCCSSQRNEMGAIEAQRLSWSFLKIHNRKSRSCLVKCERSFKRYFRLLWKISLWICPLVVQSTKTTYYLSVLPNLGERKGSKLCRTTSGFWNSTTHQHLPLYLSKKFSRNTKQLWCRNHPILSLWSPLLPILKKTLFKGRGYLKKDHIRLKSQLKMRTKEAFFEPFQMTRLVK